MQNAFDKLKGVDIFSLKSYLEPTEGLMTSVIAMLNELLVNFPFFLLNLIVGFFSLTIRVLENVNLYDKYKHYVYRGAQSIWQNFTGAKTGIAQNSLVYLIFLILGFYLFYQFMVSKGNFSRKVLHVLVVILLGFGYFGTVSGTSGGLYLLDTIDNVAKTATDKLASVSVTYGDNQTIKIGSSIADSYIADTSYKAYLFVNTGREDGKYINRQTNGKETFDDSKVLGGLDASGKFKSVSTADREKYLDEIGNNADTDKEKNRWVSAVWDYLFVKLFYIIFKIIEAIVLAIPIILIQLLNILAQALVLLMILLFPVALLVSFLPKMQDILFGVFKVTFGGLFFPVVTGLLTLMVLYLEKIIEWAVTNGFQEALDSLHSLSTFKEIFQLMISVVSKATIYYFLWKYKGELLELLLGSKAKIAVDDIETRVSEVTSQTKDRLTQLPTTATNAFDMAQRSNSFLLAGAGLGAGVLMNSGKHFKNLFSSAQPPVNDERMPYSTEPADTTIEEDTQQDNVTETDDMFSTVEPTMPDDTTIPQNN